MDRSRRTALALGCGLIIPWASGCLDGLRGQTPQPSETATSSPGPPASASDALPRPENGWRLDHTGGMDWRMLGGETGVRGYFESPDGVRFQVVVMEMAEGYDATAKARRWSCVGWDVTLAYEGFAFAAGTGTDQSKGTFTPEQPPHMTRSPVPGSTAQSRTLLSYSPMLSAEIISSNEQDCPDG